MGLFDNIFGSKINYDKQPNVVFGRYSDSYKSKNQYAAWDESLDLFDEHHYMDAFMKFFEYLNDEKLSNVSARREADVIHFELYQGSKKITGLINTLKVESSVKVAKANELNIGFLRRIMEQNYALRYAKYALNEDDDIVMLFNSFIIDSSPYKLYYGLKEIATIADKNDDLLLEEFDSLQAVEAGHIENLGTEEKELKYNFIIQKIKGTFQKIDQSELNLEQYPGSEGYLLLDLLYKIDFLTRPEGYVMEQLERSHRKYFENDSKSQGQKNKETRKIFQKLLERDKEDYFKEFYKVKSSFGITTPANHDRVSSFINGELPNMDWYIDESHHHVSLAIAGYIVGYCLFNYALPKPDRELFQLYYHIVENQYFNALGFTFSFYDRATRKLDKKSILDHVEYIEEINEDEFPNFKPRTSMLVFDSLPKFARSYLQMIMGLDLSKVH